MPAVLRKILGSSTYFLICCGSELSHMTTPTYEKGWENVIFILGSHMPGQRLGDITRWQKSLLQCPISSHVTPLSLAVLQPQGFPSILKQASSYLPQGLCSCRFIWLARPSSNNVAGSSPSRTQLQRHFLRGTVFDRPRATHPLSRHTAFSREHSPPHSPLPPSTGIEFPQDWDFSPHRYIPITQPDSKYTVEA